MPSAVWFGEKVVWVSLHDGRIVGTPVLLHPWLANAAPEQQANVELGIFTVDWPDLDEGLDIEWMIQEANKQGEAMWRSAEPQ